MINGINVPKPLIDVKEFLPRGIAPNQNGMVDVHLLKKVHNGAQLYVDAARSWNAMVEAAAQDNVTLDLHYSLNAYKNLVQQRRLFLSRFAVVDPSVEPAPDAVRVEFDNKTYELQPKKEFVERPGEMSHGYGLAVFISNGRNRAVKDWLDHNAADFGFFREYDFIPGRFVYTKARESVPERVLDVESLMLEAKGNEDDDANVDRFRAELNFYKKISPEAAIFRRKKKMAQRLLEIDVDTLKDAPEQDWYNEYHALLQIRLETPALICLARKYCDELMAWYDEHAKKDERELALLGFIQFLEPTELTVPFNQHLWSKEMIADVRGVFTKSFTRVSFSDDEISTYWLARQQTWKHGRRKMRLVYLIDSNGQSDKMMLTYKQMKARDDVDVSICLYAARDYKLNDKWCKWFRATYPGTPIYDFNSLFDLRKLKPDYVFIQGPYESRRQQPGLSANDLVKFTKVIHLSYGVTLAHEFIDRLLDSQARFYRNVYMMFCSGESVRRKMIERYSDNAAAGRQQFEFHGYTTLAKPPLEQDEHSKKTILWTPRWTYEPRIGGSHFLEYKDNFVALRDRYGDKVNLSMRPHGNTFRDLQEKHLITKEELDAYKQTVADKSIEIHPTSFDLYENFRRTDILIGDYSSILPVYFITGRPLIYCEYPNAIFLDEYKEMYDCLYIAHDWDEVLHYLDDLVAGNDPLFERRQEAVAKIRALHANAAQRIVDRIVEDFNRSEVKQ